MEFYEQVDQVQQLVARHGRVSRRGLERTYGDDELVTELAEELIVRGVAAWDADVLVACRTNADDVAGVDVEPAGGGSVGAVGAGPAPDAGSVTEFGHDAQIRHLTVMFCDVVGSTALSGELGAEVWTDAMRTVLSLCADHVRQWQGHVGAYLGDGVLAYFGYPIALENAGERAVRASLGILAGLPALNDSLRARLGRDLEVRIGIHSGPVVVDEVDGWVQASGLTTNIAARVQGEASPNSIAMTAATQRLVSGVFITEDLGVHQLKGVPEPLPLQRVVGFASPSRQRALARHATRFAGRRAELEQLEQRWAAAEHGEGQTVVLVGEAGIGKSRLIDHFRRSLGVTRHTWLEARGSSFANAAPLTPIAQLLRRAMALDDRAGVETIRVAVERALSATGLGNAGNAGNVDLIVELLDPRPVERSAGEAEARRIHLLDLLVDWVATMSAAQPSVFYLDDYHWVDPTTRVFFERLRDRAGGVPLLLIVSSRPDARPDWSTDRVTTIELAPLEAADVTEVVRQLGGAELSDDTVRSIIERSEGVPLFLEEITAAVLSGVPSERRIPDTIENLLMSRIDRVPGLRDVAQAASVIGQEFDAEQLALLVDLAKALPVLEVAVSSGVLLRSDDDSTTFSFRHALTRDATYASMVSRTRHEHHRRYANSLVSSHPYVADSRPDVLAEHFELGDDLTAASRWWQRAGRRAHARAAYPEATRFYERAVASEPSAEPARLIELNLALVGSISASRGHHDDSTSPVWERVLALAEQAGDRWSQAISYRGLAGRSLVRGDAAGVDAHSRRAWEIIGTIDAPELEKVGHTGDVIGMLYSGHPTKAIGLAERVRGAGIMSSEWVDHILATPIDPWMDAHYAYSLAATGRFDDAYAVVDQVRSALDMVGTGASTSLLAVIRGVHALDGDWARYAQLSEEFYERAQRFGLGYQTRFGRVVALITRGIMSPDPAILDQFQTALSQMPNSGSVHAAPFMLWLMAGAQLACERPDLALGSVEFGEQLALSTTQSWYDPQLLARRMRAHQALGTMPDGWEDEADAMLEHAARRELRVGGLHVAMAVLDQHRGTPSEPASRARLGDLIDDLPDRSDTPLRREARALLDR